MDQEGKQLMAIFCDITVKATGTAQQFKDLGAALWRWCMRTVGKAGIYQYLDNQVLADLMDGKLSAGHATWKRGVHVGVWDAVSVSPQAAIDRLRLEIPQEGVEDIVVNGASWQVPRTKSGNLDPVIAAEGDSPC
jgi:hypothetical protein